MHTANVGHILGTSHSSATLTSTSSEWTMSVLKCGQPYHVTASGPRVQAMQQATAENSPLHCMVLFAESKKNIA